MANWTLRQVTTGDGGTASATSYGRAYASSPLTGSLLVCAVHWSNSAETVSVADNQNGAWTPIGSPTIQGANAVQFFYLPSVSVSAATTVTATASGAAMGIQSIIAEYTGGSSNNLDAQNGNTGASGTTATVSLTTAGASDLVAVSFVAPAGTAPQPGAGYTSEATNTWNHTQLYYDNVSVAAGVQNITGTWTSSSTWSIVAVAFGAAGVDTVTLTGAYRLQ